jgi:Family of unknown function (DUF5694)
MKTLTTLLTAFFLNTALATAQSQPTEVMLIGVFHFHNPGLDVAQFKVDDMLSDKRQREIEEVRQLLVNYRPDAIFTEVGLPRRQWLDSTYQAFRKDQKTIKTKRDELYQLVMPVAQRLNHPMVYATDGDADFPYDSLMKSIKEAGQIALEQKMMKEIEQVQNDLNQRLAKDSIKSILLWMNTPKQYRLDMGWYVNMATRAGKLGNEIGAVLAGNWYTRNLKIYGNILKQLKGDEKRIVIIYGASHCALLDHYFSLNDQFKVVPLQTVLK